MSDGTPGDPRRALPAVEQVAGALDAALPHPLRVQCAREAIAEVRDRLERIEGSVAAAVTAEAGRRARERLRHLVQPVVNATGVVIHTNLGRAPLGESTLDGMATASRGYSNLEYRLDTGRRGSRHDGVPRLLADLCGAEAGLVVNNNAAALLLILAAMAQGRDVVISRGELIEIGDGFRIPDIMRQSYARLVEVGTTNRTRVEDYEQSLTLRTALILKVHTSNYRQVGFVGSASVGELARLDRPLVVDAGSGLVDEEVPWLESPPPWLAGEPGVRQCVEAGADLVCFSGDKLFGGPQAGIVVGRAEAIEALRRHPLARALRADKTCLAGLQDVALAYLDGRALDIPTWAMLAAPVEELAQRAEVVAAKVPGAVVVATEAVAGGGSIPGLTIPSVGVRVEAGNADRVAAGLRDRNVVARVEGGAVVCDLRTVRPDEDGVLADALAGALGGGSG